MLVALDVFLKLENHDEKLEINNERFLISMLRTIFTSEAKRFSRLESLSSDFLLRIFHQKTVDGDISNGTRRIEQRGIRLTCTTK